MQAQDITFTVILDDMMSFDYDALIRFIKERGTGDIQTYTYDPEDPDSGEHDKVRKVQ